MIKTLILPVVCRQSPSPLTWLLFMLNITVYDIINDAVVVKTELHMLPKSLNTKYFGNNMRKENAWMDFISFF